MNERLKVFGRYMPAVNSTGRYRMAYYGSLAVAVLSTQDQQRDLGDGVGLQPKRQPDWVHVPGLANRCGPATDKTVDQSTVVQLLF